jgi:glycosidase
MTKPAFILLIFCFLCCSVFSQKYGVAKWPRAVSYEIYIQSFADSNGDGKGDINGATDKLDYLMDLGVQAVWLMPIHPSDSYHKYDVNDYYAVDPAYGNLDDIKRFVKEAHKRYIKVIMDLVINHTSRNHPWFQAALKDSTSPYWHYYVWAHKDDPRTQMQGNITAGETRRRNRWQKLEGSDYLYYAQFGAHMPDLNFDNPRVKDEIMKIGKFWAVEVGIDGFRLDAAKHIFPDERAAENHIWWQYFIREMRKINKDFYLVGEVWAETDEVAPYLVGIPALFNFDLAASIIRAINTGAGDSIAIKHKLTRDFYSRVNPDFIDATFLSNHDQNRIMSAVDNSETKARLAAAILFTLPGSPYIYYGEEIGMKGKKPDEFIREPFLWDIKPEDKIRATWEQPRFSTDSTMTPAELQLKNDQSLFNFYRDMIRLRNRTKSLTFGEMVPVNFNRPSITAFTRSFEDESLLVLHNVSGTDVQFEIPDKQKEYKREYFKHNGAALKENIVIMPAYSTLILKRLVSKVSGW